MVKNPCSFKRLACYFAITAAVISAPSASYAQDADSNVSLAEFESVLQQINDLNDLNAYNMVLVEQQNQRIKTLEANIENTAKIQVELRAGMVNMVNAIEAEFEADPPFLQAERANRLGELRDELDKKPEEANPGLLWAKGLNAVKIEAQYGQSMEAYGGDHPIADKRTPRTMKVGEDEKGRPINADGKFVDGDGYVLDEENDFVRIYDGKYLRYGRLGLMFMDAAEQGFWRYNEDGQWDEVDGGQRNEIREAMKVADGRTAPVVIRAPLILGSVTSN